MASQEGFRRLHRLAAALACCGPVGAVIWFIQFLTFGRWGLVELAVLGLVPVLMAGSLRVVTWVLEGFLRS
jgi:hypothetical protein